MVAASKLLLFSDTVSHACDTHAHLACVHELLDLLPAPVQGVEVNEPVRLGCGGVGCVCGGGKGAGRMQQQGRTAGRQDGSQPGKRALSDGSNAALMSMRMAAAAGKPR